MDQIEPSDFLNNINERLKITTTIINRYNSFFNRLENIKKEIDATEVNEGNNMFLEKINSFTDENELDDANDDYADRVFYFKYYLDFSSAMEFMIKQILFLQYHDMEFVNKKINYQGEKFAALFPPDEVNMIISAGFSNEISNYTYGDLYQFIANDLQLKQVSNRKTRKKTEFITKSDFTDSYGTVEKYRHKVAHSMELKNVTYKDTILMDFCLCFYIIYKFYEKNYVNFQKIVK